MIALRWPSLWYRALTSVRRDKSEESQENNAPVAAAVSIPASAKPVPLATGVDRATSPSVALAGQPNQSTDIVRGERRPTVRERPRPDAAHPENARPSLNMLHLTSVELVVSPFTSFRDVERFLEILARIPDVRGRHLRRLQRGALQVRVECHGSTGLIAALRGAYPQSFFHLQPHDPHRVEVLLETEFDEADIEPRRRAGDSAGYAGHAGYNERAPRDESHGA